MRIEGDVESECILGSCIVGSLSMNFAFVIMLIF